MHALLSAKILATANLSEVVRAVDVVPSVGLVFIPGWTAASLGFQVSDREDGIFAPLRNKTGSIVEVTGIVTTTGAWYPLPVELNGAAFFKLWSQTSGSNVAQTVDRLCLVSFKG